MKRILQCLLAVAAFPSPCSVAAFAPITFDDVAAVEYAIIPSSYRELQWDNLFIQNGADPSFSAGVVSSPNVALNGSGNPAGISSMSPFTLQSCYFTAAYVDKQDIRVQGFAAGVSVYDNTYTVSGTAPTWVNLNYLNIDQVRFSITSSPNGIFAMDELMLVPEPSSGALLLIAAALRFACARVLRERRMEGGAPDQHA